MLSVIINAIIAVLAFGAVAAHTKKAPLRIVLRYFTALSNVFCGLTAIAVVICRICGVLPRAVLVLKYMGTVSVTVTLLTVLFFLVPTMKDIKRLLTGPDLFLHLICPVLALVSYFAWDKPSAPWFVVILGILPLALYAALYIYKVLWAPEGKQWKDFYGFNRGGKWPLSLAAMLLGTLVISFVLWLL